MQNATRFLLDDSHAGVGRDDVPAVFKLRQHFPRPVEPDLVAAVRREMTPILAGVEAGQRIAVTGSSRGIANLAPVVRECVSALREAGADPFVVPAMGSHGGATPEGRCACWTTPTTSPRRASGAGVVSSMEWCRSGPPPPVSRCTRTSSAMTRTACSWSTGSSRTPASPTGGKRHLQDARHRNGEAGRRVEDHHRAGSHGRPGLEGTRIVVESTRPRLVGAIALVENAFKETAVVRGVPVGAAMRSSRRSALLEHAYTLLPRLPFDELDGLIVDEIGKNVSGAGMDTNVIGKKDGLTRPRIGAIYVRGLTEGTHGNAVGLGNADIMPRSLLSHVDLNSTYMNALTAKRLSICKMPMLVGERAAGAAGAAQLPRRGGSGIAASRVDPQHVGARRAVGVEGAAPRGPRQSEHRGALRALAHPIRQRARADHTLTRARLADTGRACGASGTLAIAAFPGRANR